MPFTLPKPIGTYTVGMRHMSFKYTYCGEEIEVPMYVYYPSDSNEGKQNAPYIPQEVLEISPSSMAIGHTITQFYQDIAVSSAKPTFPLHLFNLGYGCYLSHYSVLCSDLASCGFIVPAIGHKDDTFVMYPDKRAYGLKQEYMDEMMNEKRNKELGGYIPSFEELADRPEVVELGREFFSKQPLFNSRIPVWVADSRAVIDFFEAENTNPESPFLGKLDFSKGVSCSGHSFGGGTNVDLAREDKRVVCGINIDGGNFGYHYGEDIKKPFLSIGNKSIQGMLMGYTLANTCDTFFVSALDAEHLGFTDFIHFDFKDRVGTRDRDNMRLFITEYVLSFIRTYHTHEQEHFGRLDFDNTKYIERRVC